MKFKNFKKLLFSLSLLFLLPTLGGCELYVLSMLSGDQLTDNEVARIEKFFNEERRRFNQNSSDFNEMTNSQANADIFKDPRNFLTYSNPGFNADHMTRNTYPGIFCGTGPQVSSSLRGAALSNDDINSTRSFLQFLGIPNPSLAQITSFCGGF